jgi:hypothetical protein
MPVSRSLERLIEASAPYWGGEAEVCRTYWDWPGRNRETDSTWLLRQMYKEYWEGFHRPFAALVKRLEPGTGGNVDRHEALELSKLAYEELSHYCAFADVYAALDGANGQRVPDPQELVNLGIWPENDELMRLRAEHARADVTLGPRAVAFTEGGYCALFSEGMKLAGRGGIDDRIAAACARVFDDEFDHMLAGIVDIDDASLGANDWQTITDMTVEQLRARVRMRDAQFGHPLPAKRLTELLDGAGEPVKIDYRRAQRGARTNAAHRP